MSPRTAEGLRGRQPAGPPRTRGELDSGHAALDDLGGGRRLPACSPWMHARQLAALARITNEQRLVDRGGALAGLPAQAVLPRAADCVLFRVQRLPTYMGRALTG